MNQSTEREAAIDLREGDVYNFTYSAEAAARWRTDPYWCFDGQLIFLDGKLCDTFWAGYKLGRGGDMRVVDPSDGTLTFVCNLNDVREIQDHERRYYDPEVVFNLSHHHGCYKFYAVRKDESRSQTAMLAWIDAKAAEIELDIAFAKRHLVRLAEARELVASGNVEVSIG